MLFCFTALAWSPAKIVQRISWVSIARSYCMTRVISHWPLCGWA